MYRHELVVGVELDLEQAMNSVVRHETLQHAGGKLQGTPIGGRHYHGLGAALIIIEIALGTDGKREAGAAAGRDIVHSFASGRAERCRRRPLRSRVNGGGGQLRENTRADSAAWCAACGGRAGVCSLRPLRDLACPLRAASSRKPCGADLRDRRAAARRCAAYRRNHGCGGSAAWRRWRCGAPTATLTPPADTAADGCARSDSRRPAAAPTHRPSPNY